MPVTWASPRRKSPKWSSVCRLATCRLIRHRMAMTRRNLQPGPPTCRPRRDPAKPWKPRVGKRHPCQSAVGAGPSGCTQAATSSSAADGRRQVHAARTGRSLPGLRGTHPPDRDSGDGQAQGHDGPGLIRAQFRSAWCGRSGCAAAPLTSLPAYPPRPSPALRPRSAPLRPPAREPSCPAGWAPDPPPPAAIWHRLPPSAWRP